jgi:acyl-CoA oxidase
MSGTDPTAARRLAALNAQLGLAADGSSTGTMGGRAPESAAGAPTHAAGAGHLAANLTAAPNALGAELQALLDHDCPRERQRLKALMADPLFTPRWNVSVAEERELALARLRKMCSSGCFSITDFRTNPLRIFAAHELATWADVSMATKMTVQFNLFGGTVLKLGTKKHHDALLRGIDSLDDVGCFGLTELVRSRARRAAAWGP